MTQRRVGRGRRRGTNWVRAVTSNLVTVPAGNKSFALNFLLSNASLGETVVRTIGGVYVLSDQSASIEYYTGAFGMIVINDLALGVGATAIPGPVTDSSDDGWFVWQAFMGNDEGAAGGEPGRQGFHFMFDSKAARRVEEGFGIAMMFENASGSTGVQVGFWVSLLSVQNT